METNAEVTDTGTYAAAASRGALKYPFMAIVVKDSDHKFLSRQEFAEIWLQFRDKVCQYVELGVGQPLRSDGRSWKDGKGYIACEDLFTLNWLRYNICLLYTSPSPRDRG